MRKSCYYGKMQPKDEYAHALELVHARRLNRNDAYFEVPTVLLVHRINVKMEALPKVSLYEMENQSPRLIRSAEQPFSALALSLRPSVWVHESEMELIYELADAALLNPASNAESRMESLRRSAILVVEDLFDNPSRENIAKSVKAVGSFVYLLMRDPKAYLYLSKLSSHDPYTLQHSVGTAINSIILARKTGIHSEAELLEAGLAGLLHDVGKVKVSKEIINKPGPLDELEWEEMRQHSLAGYQILESQDLLSLRTKRAVLEHHEDQNGTGYPYRRLPEQVHFFSKIVSLSDIFNALTTNRSYSSARTPFDAFQLIRDKMKFKVDEGLFRELVKIYGGEVE